MSPKQSDYAVFWLMEKEQRSTTLGLPRLHDTEEIQQFAKEFPGKKKQQKL